jgi:hypothetical protein
MKNTLRFAKMQLRFLLLKRWLWGSMLIVCQRQLEMPIVLPQIKILL